MERLTLLVLAPLLASIVAVATADSAKVALYRKSSQLDPNGRRSAQNVVYYGEFFLGTPAKQFTGCFDTGSSDTWLPSVMCFDPSCTSHDRFNPSDSSSYKSSAASASASSFFQQRASSWGPFMVVYGTGQVAGTVAADTLHLGNITVKNQGFGLVLSSSSDFLDISCDGLFGLGFPAISNLKTTPAFFNMLNDGTLDQPLFSLYFNPNPSASPAGELTFGALDDSKYVDKISYAPVTVQKYWTVGLDGISVKGAAVTVAANSVVIDSGTSAILLGPEDATAIHSAIPGITYDRSSGYWKVVGGCANVASLPPVTFTIGGVGLDLQPQQWTRSAVSESSDDYSGDCVSVMIGSGISSNTILGAPFLRGFYSVYTYDMASKQAQVGFAKAAATAR